MKNSISSSKDYKDKPLTKKSIVMIQAIFTIFFISVFYTIFFFENLEKLEAFDIFEKTTQISAKIIFIIVGIVVLGFAMFFVNLIFTGFFLIIHKRSRSGKVFFVMGSELVKFGEWINNCLNLAAFSLITIFSITAYFLLTNYFYDSFLMNLFVYLFILVIFVLVVYGIFSEKKTKHLINFILGSSIITLLLNLVIILIPYIVDKIF